MKSLVVLAVDLGAESGRVMAVHFDGRTLHLDELHRFPNTAVTVGHTLYWDILHLWREIQTGIEKGKVLQPASIGVDTWGVDFALLDRQDRLLGNPVHYRDGRTTGMMERAFARVPKEEIFAQTGIQFMPINTLYQLLSLVESKSPQLQIAGTFLTISDLLNFWLTGVKVCEFSNATTTQIFNPGHGRWATDLMSPLDIPFTIFPEIVPPGTRLGAYKGISVIAPACHDTGSAVAAVPTQTPDFAYISSGTWSLVGLEVERPILTAEALAANVTNEGGVYGTYRLLKNVMGLWILQQCRAQWAGEGQSYSYAELVELAREVEVDTAVFNPNDPIFLAPGDHPQRIRALCQQVGQPVPESPGEIVRSVLQSLAWAYREVLHEVTACTEPAEAAVAAHPVSTIHIVGGGSQNELLIQLTADATGLPVIAGPVEATVIGNALVQLISLGEIADLPQARQIVAEMAELKRYEPRANS
ncbi:MAG TPA: rhamnulokinase family protein [Chloroflexota bacterium]|nr:rhamnulokinase family protein [Chloroflexota bacterium]HUM67301.1 rhamnulokinase family protein [Chloroflexota bacterium]